MRRYGDGHTPPNPHPNPKRTEPTINLKVIGYFFSSTLYPNIGFFLGLGMNYLPLII